MKSDHSMDPPVAFKGEFTGDQRVQVERAGSPAPSCLSMKSDHSMPLPDTFRGEFTGDQRVQVERAGSPVPSCLSMKSDHSMPLPDHFRGEFTGDQRVQVERAGSPVPSCLSMKSDHSMPLPETFRGEFTGDQRIQQSLKSSSFEEKSSDKLSSAKKFTEDSLPKIIVDGPYPSISERFSTDLRDLVRDLLQKNPADRPSASDILGRPFLLRILIKKTKGILEEVQQKLKELDGVADGLERVHFGTTVGSLTGGVVGAAGGITTIVGLALAPVTLGASLIVTGVGIGVSAAGGVTGAASNVTKMVNERTDRRTIENIIHECEAKMLSLVTCLQLISKGFEDLDQSRAVRVLGGSAKLATAVQAFSAASQAVRLPRAAEVVTRVFAGLSLAGDIFFIVDDSGETHAMRQQGSNKYTKMEGESEESPDEASAGPQASSAAMTQEGSSASNDSIKMEDSEKSSDEASSGPQASSAAMTQEGSSASNEGIKMEDSEKSSDEASAGPQAGSAEGKKALKTREYIKKIREVSAELWKWLNDLESVYSTITELEKADLSV